MELSSKRVFRMRGPISICWPPHPYELLESTPEADGGHEKRNPTEGVLHPRSDWVVVGRSRDCSYLSFAGGSMFES